MPSPNELPRSSTQETSTLLPLVPLLDIQPYKIDQSDKNIMISTTLTASSARAQLYEYFSLKELVCETVLPSVGMSKKAIYKIRRHAYTLSKAVEQHNQSCIDTYMHQLSVDFLKFRVEDTYPLGVIKILETYEESIRRRITINSMKPIEFAKAFNEGKIPIPQVSEKIHELWCKRDDSSDTGTILAALDKVERNEEDLFTAISEQSIGNNQVIV
jgi:hypothetical protein